MWEHQRERGQTARIAVEFDILRSLLIAASLLAVVAPARGEDTLVPVGAVWRYHKGTAEASSPVTAWREVSFDDSAWLSGPTGIGYGDGDDATVLSDMQNGYISVFLRRRFTVADPGAVFALDFSIDHDDGFVAYLNASEIARAGLVGEPVPFNAAATSHEAGTPSVYAVDPALLVPGLDANVLSIQVHNQALNSSDLSCIPSLIANPDVELTRGPYLQLAGPDTMTIVWKTDAVIDGTVEYGTTPALGASASDPAGVSATHVVTLDGLTPGQSYFYRVLSGGAVLAEDLRFETFPDPASGTTTRVLAFGDSGSGTSSQLLVRDRIAAITPPPDLVLHTGDVVYESGESQNFDPRYFVPYRDQIALIPFYPSLGNHDVGTSNGQPYLDAFHLPSNNPLGTERYYSFERANVHFICLDTTQALNTGSAQHSWLREDLRSMGGFWTVVFQHHTPYTTESTHANDSVNAIIRAHIAPLLEEYGVDLVLVGHSHCYERTAPILDENPIAVDEDPDYLDPGGPIWITTGGGGRSLRSQASSHPNLAFNMVYHAAYHVTVLDFDGLTVTGQAIRSDGAQLDSFSLTRTLDTIAPDIANIAAVDIEPIRARVIWITDELADSVVEFGLTPALGSLTSLPARSLSHSVSLESLQPGERYYFRVRSTDRAGNTSTSGITSFLTLGDPVDPHAVAYWRLEDSLDDLADGARHGAGVGHAFATEVPGSTVPQTGVVNARSLALDGTAHVSFPDGTLDLIDTSSASVECFARLAIGGAGVDRVLWQEGGAGADGSPAVDEMSLRVSDSGALRFEVHQGGALLIQLSSADGSVLEDSWHHCAVIFDSGEIRLLLDRVPVAILAAAPAISKSLWSGEFRVGSTLAGTRPWLGEIDELRVSDVPLVPGLLLATYPRFELDVQAPGGVFRRDLIDVELLGSSSLRLFGFSATLRYDPTRVRFQGSAPTAFVGSVWESADSLGLVDDPDAGVLSIGVVGDLAGTDDPIGPFESALFARLEFESTGCTGAVVFELDESDPDHNVLVTEQPAVIGVDPLTFDAATLVSVGETFVRGDINSASAIDPDDPAAVVTIGDALFLLIHLYQGGPEPPCQEAADVDANGRIQLVDAVWLLQHLFGNPNLATIPAPWPDVGRAPAPSFTCYNPPGSECAP